MKISTKSDLERLFDSLRRMKLPIEVNTKRWVAKRTHEQNAYLFGVCYPPISEATGYATEEIHEWMCGTFFGWVDRQCPKTPRNQKGIESAPFRTTTRNEHGRSDVISKQQFSDFLETVVFPTASKIGVIIPEPFKDHE